MIDELHVGDIITTNSKKGDEKLEVIQKAKHFIIFEVKESHSQNRIKVRKLITKNYAFSFEYSLSG